MNGVVMMINAIKIMTICIIAQSAIGYSMTEKPSYIEEVVTELISEECMRCPDGAVHNRRIGSDVVSGGERDCTHMAMGQDVKYNTVDKYEKSCDSCTYSYSYNRVVSSVWECFGFN